LPRIIMLKGINTSPTASILAFKLQVVNFILVISCIMFFFFQQFNGNFSKPAHPKIKANTTQVLIHLQNLQDIAIKHGNSRSTTNGHKASVKYIVDNINLYKDTWKVWTEQVDINVQVNEYPPFLSVVRPNSIMNDFVFQPRTQVATMTGSGSIKLTNTPVKFVDSCIGVKTVDDFIAVIDATSSIPMCGACDKMLDAIEKGAKGVIFINRPGNQAGYPKSLSPSPGRCGRNPVYQSKMKLIGAVSLSDDAAFAFMSMLLAKPDIRMNMKVVSAYRTFPSTNVLAETHLGSSDSVILYGSHLDSVPAGFGINDDGSGAVGTLDLARAFAQSSLAKKHSKLVKQKIRLAFWTAEEIGLVGSYRYVANLTKNHPEELKKIKLSMDTDMIASSNYIRGVYDGTQVQDLTLRKGCVAIQKVYQSFFASMGLPTAPGNFDGRSDYAAFMDVGIPSGGLFTGAESIKTAAQAELFGGVIGVCQDPCYHQVNWLLTVGLR
jgi:Peptidase family M28